MHVLESTATVARRSFRRLVTDVFEERSLTVHITNGTHSELRVVEPRCIGAGSCSISFAQLGPGEAGDVRFFSSQGSYASNVASGCHHAGAVELLLGDERLFLGESNPLGQSLIMRSRFSLEFVADARKALQDFYSDMPFEFMGSQGARSVANGRDYTARVSVISHKNPAEVDVLLLDDEIGEVEYELDSLQQLQFAEWCREHAHPCLPSVFFLAELGAIMSALALKKLDAVDKAFSLDLLISAFVTSGMLDIPPEAVAMNMEQWRATTWPPGLPHAELPQRSAYAGCEAAASAMARHADAARLLLRAAALCCTKALRDAVHACKAIGEWPCRLMAGAWDEALAHKSSFLYLDAAANAAILAEHLGDASLPLLDRPEPGEAEDAGEVAVAGGGTTDTIKASVRHCIHTSADYAVRRAAILDSLETQQSSNHARAALQHYRHGLLLSQRRFIATAGLVTPEITFDSFCLEGLGNLDGGKTTSPQRTMRSLGYSAPEYESMSTNSKSGEFFFFSKDRRFLIKTITEKECVLLGRLMPAYQDHIRKWPRSLIVRFAGLFQAQVGTKRMHFVVMTSVFDPACKVHETFDLKGSLYNRKKKEGESIGKDEDWLAPGRRLLVSPALRRELCEVHELDAMLLTRFKIMDYSVLVGIHYLEDGEERGRDWRETGGIFAEDGSAVYFVGIIDFSIKYSLRKHAETVVNVLRGCDRNASCVSQDTYAMRQVRFVRDHVLRAEGTDEEAGTMGVLTVHVMSGQDLMAADWLGTSDPYVRITLGLLSKQTHTVQKSCNPNWDCTIKLPVNTQHVQENIELAVWDEDANRALRGSDDFLGKLLVPMAAVLTGPQELLKANLLEARRGQLSVRLAFASEEADSHPEHLEA